jgi:S-adenosylmethionine:tRNA ribosyltransferase-isomerase
MSGALEFELPPALEAHAPPRERDGVRLLVATRHDGRLVHARFRDLPSYLRAGDLVVVNTSATLPAALPAGRLTLHLSTPAPDGGPWGAGEGSGVDEGSRTGEGSRMGEGSGTAAGSVMGEATGVAAGPRFVHRWIVELRDGPNPSRGGRAGDAFPLPAGGRVELLAPYAAGRRLWLARLDLPSPLLDYVHEHGRPIRYGYVPRNWPLEAYQNAYALEPGSAEMASAGRPFTPELITRLVAAGVHVAPVTLHTGVSSPERSESPYPERFRVPAATARLVNAVHDWAGRVVAVGTTVVRALESVAAPGGAVRAGEGWTRLVIGPDRGLRAVDGVLTGWHEPEASHLELLRAAAGDELLARAYRAALDHGYLWHEFGDSHLVLP